MRRASCWPRVMIPRPPSRCAMLVAIRSRYPARLGAAAKLTVEESGPHLRAWRPMLPWEGARRIEETVAAGLGQGDNCPLVSLPAVVPTSTCEGGWSGTGTGPAA
jgi:hypothetical protein